MKKLENKVAVVYGNGDVGGAIAKFSLRRCEGFPNVSHNSKAR